MEPRQNLNTRHDPGTVNPIADWGRERASEVEEKGSELNLFQAILGHKLLIVFFLIVGGGLGFLYYSNAPIVFQSSARLRIVHTSPVIEVDGLHDAFSGARDPIDTHILLMQSPVIIDRAIEASNLTQLQSMRGASVGLVAANLFVARNKDSKEVIDLSYRGSDPDDCRKILNAVLTAYVDYLGDSQGTTAQKALELITEAKDDLLQHLSDQEEAYARFRSNASLLWAGEVGKNIHAERLAGIEAQRAQIMVEQTMLESQLKSLQTLLARGENREAIIFMIDQLEKDTEGHKNSSLSGSAVTLAQELMPLILEEQLLLERFGTGHPKVKEIQKRIEITRSLIQAQEPTAGTNNAPRPDILQVYLDSLRHEIGIHREKLEQLNALFQSEQISAKRLAEEENQNRALREEITRSKQLFETVLTKLKSVELSKDTGTLSAEPIISPGQGYRVAPHLSRSIVLGSVGGACVGILISVLIEMTDRSYRTQSDITRHLGVPVIGHIPALKTDKIKPHGAAQSVDPTVFAVHRPNSGITESYRNVRTALMLGIASGQKVFQITSPNPSDGKSTLSANLSTAIAQSGKKCLLMDCDLRRPRVHKLFGFENKTGLSSVLTEKSSLAEAVSPGPVENLDLLSSGPRVKNPAELLMNPRFAQLLEQLREQYDIVMIDSPPILAVSDPTTVASMVDGVLLVTRVGRNSRPLLARVHESLAMVGANLLGVVVNGVGGDQSRYNGSYSRYSSQYGYGYQYGRYGKYSQYHDESPLPNGSKLLNREKKQRLSS